MSLHDNLEHIDKASLRFYSWEARYRGYMLFPHQVSLELPFTPYQPYTPPMLEDDGVVARWWQKKRPPVVSESEELEWKFPKEFKEKGGRIAMVLTFSGESESRRDAWEEILTRLSKTSRICSFEIIGTAHEIRVQMTCLERDYGKITSLLGSYFPALVIREGDLLPHIFDGKGGDIAIADFGLEYEFMLPLNTSSSGEDSLLSLLSFMDSLSEGDCIMYQVLFSGVKSPIARDARSAMSDGHGGCFFEDESMLELTHEKTRSPLFASMIRVMCQGRNKRRSKMLAHEMIDILEQTSRSAHNGLVALSNEGYSYREHSMNVFRRASNRTGMILNSKELSILAHVPERMSLASKLTPSRSKTKHAPAHVLGTGVCIGRNLHLNDEKRVCLSVEDRLSHMHIMGATGMGKSTVLVRMLLQDIEEGRSAILLDPHGDVVEDILLRLPERRRENVILFDPSDTDFPLGFNLLHAEREADKIVLSSDLVATFRRYATSWGDRMTSVLTYAIDTFLSFKNPGTLLELKQFLVDKNYREQRLKDCPDPLLQSYWLYDYPHLSRNSLTPLLMRFDTFLRSPVVRNMMAQTGGINIAEVMNENKVLLVKLSQGLIGEENARLLGTLIVSKIGQEALARQHMAKEKRSPCFVYLDEFQHLLTPSIGGLISGARKYGVGMVLAHQDMMQLDHERALMHSTISNTNIRMCFRLGYDDASRMEKGFASFERDDLLSLSRGEAVVRVGGAQYDFNTVTFPLDSPCDDGKDIRTDILVQSRSMYATPREEVEERITQLLGRRLNTEGLKKTKDVPHEEASLPSLEHESLLKEEERIKTEGAKKRTKRRHEYLKSSVAKLGSDSGFRAEIEFSLLSGGRVDVVLRSDELLIACEISVGNTPDYEVQNITKCLLAEFSHILMICEDDAHLRAIQKGCEKSMTKVPDTVHFIMHDEVGSLLQSFLPSHTREQKIKGYRVRVSHSETEPSPDAERQIAKTLFDGLKKGKK